MAQDEPEQDALFEIEGPDEDGCVWICSREGRDVWCQNLGPVDKAAEVLSQWLKAIGTGEANRTVKRKRVLEPPDQRKKRLESKVRQREDDKKAYESRLDDMVKRSIRDHGI